MAERIIPFTVQTGAGILIGNPQTRNINFGAAEVTQIDVMVPPGPAGFLGFYIGNGGGQYIPEGIGQWITPEDVYLSYPIENAPDNGNWSVVTYNQGNYTHTLYLFFHVNNLTIAQAAASGTPVGL